MRPVIIVWLSVGIISTNVFAQHQPGIFGTWQNEQFGYRMTLVLHADGSGNFDGEALRYKVAAQILSVTIDGLTTDYSYLLNDNTLGLAGGDLDGLIVFARSLPATVTSPGAARDGAATFSLTDTGLIGLWSGNGEMIEFKVDGTCSYLGTIFSYQVSQGHIILDTNQGSITLEYAVREGQLTLTANGQRAMYVRPAGTMEKDKSRPQGRISLELVGRWCALNMNSNSQSSRCITLNEDGTYYYVTENSRSVNTAEFSGGTASQANDSGTWYLEADRIHYHSQIKGIGSYKLEKRNHPKNVNDPMIVLDGDAFVTAVQRPAWK